jgi:hypothetical protein
LNHKKSNRNKAVALKIESICNIAPERSNDEVNDECKT